LSHDLYDNMIGCRFDFELMFDISMRSMDKATRMTFGEARSSHAMVLNGLNELVSSLCSFVGNKQKLRN